MTELETEVLEYMLQLMISGEIVDVRLDELGMVTDFRNRSRDRFPEKFYEYHRKIEDHTRWFELVNQAYRLYQDVPLIKALS